MLFFFNKRNEKICFFCKIFILPKFFSWQTHSLVETDKKSVSNDPDNGIDFVFSIWFDESAIDSDVNSNDDGHEWDFTNDGLGIIDRSSQ